MPKTFSALVAVCMIAVAAPAFAQSTKAILADHENRITALEGDVLALDGRVTALEGAGNGNGNGQGGPLVFVGFSTTTVLGDVGVDGLTGQCDVSARVCMTKEFMLSTDTDEPVGDGAWLLPEIVAVTGTTCVEFSGRDVSGCTNLSCSGWAGSGTGMSVNTAGAIVVAGCATLRFVTCCGPAP